MSVQSPYGTSSWAFWPVGDRYQLTPKFGEKYADTDSTVRAGDEKNRISVVGDYNATSVVFTMQLRDMSGDEPAVPDEQPTVYARMSKPEGWVEELTITPEFVTSTPDPTEFVPDPDPVWTGDLKFTLTRTIMDWVGYGRPVDIIVDAEFPSTAPERHRVGYGSIVLRR